MKISDFYNLFCIYALFGKKSLGKHMIWGEPFGWSWEDLGLVLLMMFYIFLLDFPMKFLRKHWFSACFHCFSLDFLEGVLEKNAKQLPKKSYTFTPPPPPPPTPPPNPPPGPSPDLQEESKDKGRKTWREDIEGRQQSNDKGRKTWREDMEGR